MAETYLSDSSLFSRFRRKLRLYLPSVEYVLSEAYYTLLASPTPVQSFDANPIESPLAAALQSEHRQRVTLNLLTIPAIALGIGAAVFLLLTNPVGWGITASILAAMVCVVAIPTIVRHAIKAIQAISNKWNSRIKLNYVSDLTPEKALAFAKQLEPNDSAKRGTLLSNLAKEFVKINADPKSNKKRILTDAELEAICSAVDPSQQKGLRYLIGFTQEKITKLKAVLGYKQTISLFMLRLLSGGTSPLDDQNIEIHAKTKTKAAANTIAGAIVLGAMTGANYFIISPVTGIVAFFATVLGVFVGARIGQEIGEGFVRYKVDDANQVNPERTFEGLADDTINHASRWWAKRFYIRSTVIVASFVGAEIFGYFETAFQKSMTTLIAYTLAGFATTRAMKGGNKKQILAPPKAAALTPISVTASTTSVLLSATPVSVPTPAQPEIDFILKPEADWGPAELAAAKTFWLEYLEKYKAKSHISNLFAAAAHRTYFNVRYLWETVTVPVEKRSEGFKMLTFFPAFFAFCLPVGLVKSVGEGIVNFFSFSENSYTRTHGKHIEKMMIAKQNLEKLALYECNLPTTTKPPLKTEIVKDVDQYVSRKRAKQLDRQASAAATASATSSTATSAPVPAPASTTLTKTRLSVLDATRLYFTADTFSKQEKPGVAPTPALRSLLAPVAPT